MGSFNHTVYQIMKQMGFPYRSLNQTEKIGIKESAGVGFVLRIVPRPDMWITITNSTLAENTSVRFSFDDATVELMVCFQGVGEVQVSGMPYRLHPNTLFLRLMDRVQGEYHFAGGQPLVTLSIHISVSTLNHFLQGINGTISTNFHHLLGNQSLHQYQQAVDVSISQLARQMVHAPYANSTRNILMESRALELLSLSFQHFLFDHEPSNHDYSITRSDLERIHQARDVMLGRMENPPSLMELSRIVGLNDYKLKAGFKKVFGTTIFGYLREKRLEKAMLHLQNGQTSVGEAAVSVGYTNASYFAEAFRKQYGINPSELIRRPSTF